MKEILMLYRAYAVLGTIILSCITTVFSMPPTQNVFELAKQYLHNLSQERAARSSVRHTRVLVEKLPSSDGRRMEEVFKESIGSFSFLSKYRVFEQLDAKPAIFFWYTPTGHRDNIFGVIVDLSDSETVNVLFLRKKKKDGSSSFTQKINRDNFSGIEHKDFFLLIVACVSAFKNRDFDVIETLLGYDQGQQYLMLTLMDLIISICQNPSLFDKGALYDDCKPLLKKLVMMFEYDAVIKDKRKCNKDNFDAHVNNFIKQYLGQDELASIPLTLRNPAVRRAASASREKPKLTRS